MAGAAVADGRRSGRITSTSLLSESADAPPLTSEGPWCRKSRGQESAPSLHMPPPSGDLCLPLPQRFKLCGRRCPTDHAAVRAWAPPHVRSHVRSGYAAPQVATPAPAAMSGGLCRDVPTSTAAPTADAIGHGLCSCGLYSCGHNFGPSAGTPPLKIKPGCSDALGRPATRKGRALLGRGLGPNEGPATLSAAQAWRP